MACIIAQCFRHGKVIFLCNVVVNHETKFVMMNARGEVIAIAKHSDDFIPSSLIEMKIIIDNELYQYHITDNINNVAIIDIPDILIIYSNIYREESIKFDFQFNEETIVKIPKNATVMFKAMNKKKRTLVLQSFSHMKNALNGVCDVLPLIFAPFMEAIKTDQSWYTIIDTFGV